MTTRTSRYQTPIAIMGPSLAIAIFYFLFFHVSLQRSTKLELAKLRKLEAIEDRTKPGNEVERLVALQEEVRQTRERIESANHSNSHFVSKRTSLCKELLESKSPAVSIAAVIKILERSELECISSAPKQPQDASPILPEPLKPFAKLLGTQKALQSARTEIKLSIQGSYLAMQNALRSLREELAEVIIVSLEMLPCDGNNMLRSWYLTVSI